MAEITDLDSFRQTASACPLCLSEGSQQLICGGFISHMAPINPGGKAVESKLSQRKDSQPTRCRGEFWLRHHQQRTWKSFLISAIGAQVG